jgi:uncharacterized Tic20 family protein
MTVMGTPSPWDDELEAAARLWPGQLPSVAEEAFAMASYLGAIILVPVVPLLVYLVARYTSQFVRWHAATALNIALTALLYAVSGTIIGVMLAFDSWIVALAIMVPVAVVGWGVAIAQLVRCANAARYGEWREVPAWICAPIVK